MREYKQSVDLMPQHHAAVYTLAQCLVQRKQFSPAIKYLENSPKHMQEEPEARQLKQWRTDVTKNLLTEWYKSFNRTPSLWKTCFQLPFCPTRVSIRLLLWQIHRVISCYVWVVPAFCAMFGKWHRCWSFWSPRTLPKTILKWTKRRVSNFTFLSPREKQIDKNGLFVSAFSIALEFSTFSAVAVGLLEAREASERLVKLAPEDVEAWIMKAEAYTRGKPKEHRKDLAKSGYFCWKLHWFSWKLNLIKRSDKKRNTCQMTIWNLAKDRWNRYTLYAICVSERPLGTISVPLIPSYIIQIGTLWFPGCCQQLRESG